jgi:tetratricopeptide (TPR) repeat protein
MGLFDRFKSGTTPTQKASAGGDLSEGKKRYAEAQILTDKGAGSVMSGRLEQGVAYFDAAIKLYPLADALGYKADTLARLDRYKESIACWDQLIKLQPSNDSARANKAKLLVKLKRYKEAAGCWGEVHKILTKIDPKNTTGLFNEALSLQQANLKQEAEQCYRKVVEIDPSASDAWNNLGMILWDEGLRDEARECYKKADRY